MPFVDFNPETDFVVPLALYSQEGDDPRSLLRFPVQQQGKWYVSDSFLGMNLKRIFYVFSPAVVPLPPETLMFNVSWIDEDPYGIVDLLYVFNPYDKKAFITSVLHGTMVFGAYRKPVPNTEALYVHTRLTSSGKIAYLSFNEKPPECFDWTSRQYSENPDISPIFVMKSRPKGFIKNTSLVCVPNLYSGGTINDCSRTIVNYKANIEDAISPKSILGDVKTSNEEMNVPLLIAIIVILMLMLITSWFGFAGLWSGDID
jgi:hypothetical protein